MKKTVFIMFVGLCTFLWPTDTKCQETVEGFCLERLTRIDSMLYKYIINGQLPGATILISRNNKIVYQKSIGYNNIEQEILMKNDNIFWIASMTKMVTAISALILYEKGHYRLNDKLSDYLPEFKNLKVFVQKDDKTSVEDAKQDILIKDLFRHTTGFKYDTKEYKAAGALMDNSLTMEEYVRNLATVPLYAEPGTRFEYAISTDVLGRLVEVLSGKPLDEFFETHIFEPLGMKDTGFALKNNLHERMVSLYDYSNGRLELKETSKNTRFLKRPKFIQGGSGLVSTTEDYSKLLQMLLNGGKYNNYQILGRKTIVLMSTNQLADVPDKGFLNDGRGHGLGVGVMDNTAKYGELYSDGSIFWSGWANTFFIVDFKENMYAILMTQVTPWSYLPYGKYFSTLTYQALVE